MPPLLSYLCYLWKQTFIILSIGMVIAYHYKQAGRPH